MTARADQPSTKAPNEPKAPAALPPESELRRPLSEEVHARPFIRLTAPERATHLAMHTGEDGVEADVEHLHALCRRYDVAPPHGVNHAILDFGDFRLKWERHTEFCSYTFFVGGDLPSDPFDAPALNAVPQDWVQAMPGELLVAVNLVLEPKHAAKRPPDTVPELMTTGNFAASEVAGGAATAFMDFAIDGNGFGRIYVRDHGLRARQAGRLIQRLLEIETYRMLSLLALPLARKYGRKLSDLGERLSEIAGGIGELSSLRQERNLLSELTTLSAETERIAAETAYRFSAARAYYTLVERRIESLREERVEGFQTFSEFMERRMAPAMRTCEAVHERQINLSERVNRTSQLLRTRVDIQLEEQNVNVLNSMDRRAKLQLRLQETVEGLSVAAITYYAVGLVDYVGKALKTQGVPVPVATTTGIAVPVIAALVWMAIRKMRRMIEKQDAGVADEAAEAGTPSRPPLG